MSRKLPRALVASATFGLLTASLGLGLNVSPAAAIAPVASTPCTPDAGFAHCERFTYTGAAQRFVVPGGVATLNVKAWGAGGGGNGAFGGNAGYATANLAVTGGSELTLVVGQGSAVRSSTRTYGGGGAGASTQGSSGGGLSSVSTASALQLVAAGGGGAVQFNGPGDGGGGGGTVGSAISAPYSASGGTQSSGGRGAVLPAPNVAAGNGTSLVGGDAANPAGGGGGGGYFGGGGSSFIDSGSGGGSSFIGGPNVSAARTEAGANGSQSGLPGGTTDSQWIAGIGKGGARLVTDFETDTVISAATDGGNGMIVMQWAAANNGIVAVNPARLVDTRLTGTTRAIAVTGANGVPSDASAVALNLTATNVTAAGWMTVWPCSDPKPDASNLNYVVGQTVANAVLVKVGTAGTVCVEASGGTAPQFIVDVNGYVPAGSPIVAATPKRILDTRVGFTTFDGQEAGSGIVAAGAVRTVTVAGRAGVPAASAVAVNVTITQPTANGFVTVWPCGTVPAASNLNFVAGQTAANLVMTPLSATGTFCIQSFGASAHFVADLQATVTIGSLAVATPVRLLDTRGDMTIDGLGSVGFVPQGQETSVQVTGRAGVSANAKSAVVNVTAVTPNASGHLVVYPCGSAPTTDVSNLNYASGRNTPNLVVVKIGTGGRICIKQPVGGTHLLVDLQGTSIDK
jgi:Glycine rich protein